MAEPIFSEDSTTSTLPSCRRLSLLVLLGIAVGIVRGIRSTLTCGIDGAGGVWLLSEERRCGLVQLTVPWLVTVPAGFVLGLVMAAGDEIVARVRRRRRASSSNPPIL